MGTLKTVKIRADNKAGVKIVNADDPRATPENIISDEPADSGRDDLGILGKADLIELLEAHGVEFDKRTGVQKLREMAEKVIYIDI